MNIEAQRRVSIAALENYEAAKAKAARKQTPAPAPEPVSLEDAAQIAASEPNSD